MMNIRLTKCAADRRIFIRRSTGVVPFGNFQTARFRETSLRMSGANLQPWHFSVITGAETKKQIRIAAEVEEKEFYEHRASAEWLTALEPLGTDSDKPFLETAPYLITVFLQKYGKLPDGRKVKHYYPVESTGIATGILITALHMAGLVCLTHTPSPMKFLNKILHRPVSDRPFLLLVTGYPAENAMVPDIGRKSLDEYVSFVDDGTGGQV
jgi:nitroreductase